MIRPATSDDLPAIQALLDQAFAPSRYESKLVESLLVGGFSIYHWVLENKRVMAAYICYSQAYRGKECIGYHLAPLAVLPEHQGKGLSRRIIRETLRQTPLRGRPIFVLGEKNYYARFGFHRVTQPRCPFEVGNHHFMALNYAGKDDFEIGYEPVFFESGPASTP
jgi:putative acetyltransferase